MSRYSLNSVISSSFKVARNLAPIFISFGSSPSPNRFIDSSSSMLGLDPSFCLSNALSLSYGKSISSSELTVLPIKQFVSSSTLVTCDSL
jgi:hypothetical protein